MIYTRQEMKNAAKRFLNIADYYEKEVSAFLNGSDRDKDADAYFKVLDANRIFLVAYCGYYGEPMIEPNLNYDLAESVL